MSENAVGYHQTDYSQPVGLFLDDFGSVIHHFHRTFPDISRMTGLAYGALHGGHSELKLLGAGDIVIEPGAHL